MPGRQTRPGGRAHASRRSSGAKSGGGAKDRTAELFQLIVAYVKQETLEPVSRQLKALAKGIAGALLLATGTVVLAIGFVRALQAELGSTGGPGGLSTESLRPALYSLRGRGPSGFMTLIAPGAGQPFGFGQHLSGDWSCVPYMGGALFAVLIAVFCVTRVRGGSSR